MPSRYYNALERLWEKNTTDFFKVLYYTSIDYAEIPEDVNIDPSTVEKKIRKIFESYPKVTEELKKGFGGDKYEQTYSNIIKRSAQIKNVCYHVLYSKLFDFDEVDSRKTEEKLGYDIFLKKGNKGYYIEIKSVWSLNNLNDYIQDTLKKFEVKKDAVKSFHDVSDLQLHLGIYLLVPTKYSKLSKFIIERGLFTKVHLKEFSFSIIPLFEEPPSRRALLDKYLNIIRALSDPRM